MNFNQLFTSRPTRQLINRFPPQRDYYVYLRNNYFDGNFPPQLWNVYARMMSSRTNNYVESFHNRWNNVVGVRHSSLWNFITILKDQLTVNDVKRIGMINGNPPPTQKLKWRRLEANINHLKRQYSNTPFSKWRHNHVIASFNLLKHDKIKTNI